ncbi:MAG: CorA family divalent cation transporter [Pseudomonadota bacterium]
MTRDESHRLKSPAIPDSEGLICAFRLGPVAPCGRDALPASGERGQPFWMHYNLTDTRTRRWLEQAVDIPQAAREVMLDPDARVHAQAQGDGLVVVLTDLHHDLRADPDGAGLLHIYFDQQRMISGRRHALKSVDHLRHALLEGLQAETPIGLFEELVLSLAETFGAVVNQIGDQVDEAEDKILAGRLHDQGTALGRMRRLLARLRRHVSADRAALTSMLTRLPRWCDAACRDRLRQAVEHVESVAQDIDLVQERTRLLQEEIAGRVGEATSKNLFVLSILTATFLPVTLVTGIFGMNVGGLPWLNDPSGFWWVGLVMVGAVVAVLVLLRRGRIL